MGEAKIAPRSATKEFKPKDAVLVFSVFSLVCLAAIFGFIVKDLFTIQHFLSFANPIYMLLLTIFASIGLLFVGALLTYLVPSKYIDNTNQEMPNYSITVTCSLMFAGALFEELLFRGIIQNLIYLFTDSRWIAIIAATLLFVCFHVRYFKKPVMLLNITLPGLVFGWVYYETSNLLVPLMVHFATNVMMTLLLKYNVLRVKQ